MHKVGQFKWVPKKDAKDTVFNWMQPAIRHSKEDCLTLPPVTQIDRTTSVSSQQRLALTELEQTSKVRLASGQVIMAVNAAVEVGDNAVTVELDLPLALKLFEPLVRGAVEANGQKLLK